MAIQTINVPDIGGAENVDVIEICVQAGDTIAVEDSLIVLESDKSSMEIPSTHGGTVKNILIKEGDQVSEGAAILELELEGDAANTSEDEKTGSVESDPRPEPSTSSPSLDVNVPDIGGAEDVDVIEVCVSVGDEVSEGDSLIVLESDKSSMEIPSPASGIVKSLAIKEGAKARQGTAILVLETAADALASSPEPQNASPNTSSRGVIDIPVPDIGGAEEVDVIEVCIAEGDDVAEGDSLIVLESDKSSMEIPSPSSGTVKKLLIKEGDKASMGTAILTMEVQGKVPVDKPASEQAPAPQASTQVATASSSPAQSTASMTRKASSDYYAGPAVRKLARQLGVELSEVSATGPRGRITHDDVHDHVKAIMTARPKGAGSMTGAGIPAVPEVDFSKFGEIEQVKMSKIKKLTAANMSRNWLNVPHVTQFDDADITELEAFRKGMKAEAEKQGVKLTPVPFLIKACAAALEAQPSFNVSLHADGEHIVHKKYVNIGMAVDTPAGLMVPVIRDANKKGVYQIAQEMMELAVKARDGKLLPADMQGGCFTISSLGAIGGQGFTPIVNAPEVAILGVSRAEMKPVWNGKEFEPRFMLPLSLSYDHRAINGGDAGRFFTYLNAVLADMRKMLL